MQAFEEVERLVEREIALSEGHFTVGLLGLLRRLEVFLLAALQMAREIGFLDTRPAGVDPGDTACVRG